MPETNDQLALIRWITAGLAIPEVRALHGDASYLLGNMIAKYSLAAPHYLISAGAVAEFDSMNVDLSQTYSRSRFYGKDLPFIYEHPVPASIVKKQLLLTTPSEKDVRVLLQQAGPVTVLLRSEDELLKSAKLNSAMPQGWAWGDNPFARYDHIGIKVSQSTLRLKGSIRR